MSENKQDCWERYVADEWSVHSCVACIELGIGPVEAGDPSDRDMLRAAGLWRAHSARELAR